MRPVPRPTSRTLGFLALGVAIGVLAWGTGQDDLVWVAIFLVAMPVAALAAALLVRPGFHAAREVQPEVSPAGEPARVVLTLSATRPGFGSDVLARDDPGPALGVPHAFRLDAGRRGARTSVAYPIRPRRRGRYTLDGLVVRSVDALGFWTFGRHAGAPTPLVVTPRVHALPPAAVRAIGEVGETPLPRTSLVGPDDATVRDYRAGDDVRRIHWRSTARTGEIMVRREESAWDPTAWVLLDSRAGVHPLEEGLRPTFEWLVTAAASIGERLLTDDYALGLVDAAGLTHEAAGEPAVAAARWLDPLVDVDVVPADDLHEAIGALGRQPSDHILIALLGRLDAATADLLSGLNGARYVRLALVVAPADDRRAEFEQARALLVRHGWDVRPTVLSSDLAATWLGSAAPATTDARTASGMGAP